MRKFINKIHTNLGKVSVRAFLLFPPLISIIALVSIAWCNAVNKIPTNKIFLDFYLLSVLYLIVGLILIFWSDSKRDKIK